MTLIVTDASGHTTTGIRIATDRLNSTGRIYHGVYFPSGPVDSIVFRSDYKGVRSGHAALRNAVASEDTTGILLAIARNRRFTDVVVHYRECY